MQDKRVIYPTDDGGVKILIPAVECGLPIEAIAAKDVPKGKPFKIVDVSDIPTDRTDRDAWVVDEADLIDGVGADYGEGSDWSVIDHNGDGFPDLLRNVRTGEYKRFTED